MNPITMKLVVDELILQALREDITFEDVSTASVCPTARPATVELIAKADGIIAGLDVFARTFELLDPQSSVLFDVVDGDEVHAGDHVGQVRGDARVLLSGERVALNYLQRMSGIATYTHNMAAALEGTKTVLVDTRKTTPGMRVFEKAAVEIGGGSNHRYNLSDGVMLKDFLVNFGGHDFTCVDRGFKVNEPVQVVIRPEDVQIVPPSVGMLTGLVREVIFKGVHFEMHVDVEGYEWIIHSTQASQPGELIGMNIGPDEIHIMKRSEV